MVTSYRIGRVHLVVNTMYHRYMGSCPNGLYWQDFVQGNLTETGSVVSECNK